MAILDIKISQVGLVGVTPAVAYISTNDTLSTVLTAGYLNQAVQSGFSFPQPCIAAVSTKTTPSATQVDVGWFEVLHTGSDWSLNSTSTPGDIVLPTTANYLAHATDTSGTLSTAAANVINPGDIQAGLSGTAGELASYPGTAASGSLRVVAVANTGNTDTIISNAAMGQATTVSIPDPGAATANFLLDTGAANILSMQEFVGLQSVLAYSAGTWTRTRVAQGNYADVKTQADDTTIIGIDITPMIRTAASKGFRLDSFDVIYQVTTLALDAHTVTLDRIEYADNVAVSVNSVAITGTLATATQANPYVTNVAVDTPAFDVTADSKYVVEVTVDAAATSDYSFYGLMLRFSQTVA